MMPARDGVRLATDIFRPAIDGEPAPGAFPAIVVRSPYNHRADGPSSQVAHGEFFASHGFLYVVQDCRGRFASEGRFELLGNEDVDGYDTVEWVAGLPFCNGSVGTQGTSLRAWNQHATSAMRPPHLKCMWINQGGFNGLRDSLRHHGALELRWLSWLVVNGTNDPALAKDPDRLRELSSQGERMYEWLTRLPWTPGNSPLAALPEYERRALDFYTKAEDLEFWSDRNLNFQAHLDEASDVPTMHVGSWYDAYAAATIDKYLALRRRMPHQYLIMGPGIHGGGNFEKRMSGEVDMGPNAPFKDNLGLDRRHMMLEFFKRWLTDEPVGPEPAAVRYFLMGGGGGAKNAAGQLIHGGVWRSADRWPQYPVIEYALGGDGMLSPGGPGDEPAAGGAALTEYRYDPAHPTPTIASAVSSQHELLPWPQRGIERPAPDVLKQSLIIQGAADQVTRDGMHHPEPLGLPLCDRPDVLMFATAPLDHPVEVTGAVTARLFLSSDAPDTDLHVMLLDLYPPSEHWPTGYRLNLVDGLQRVRYRLGEDRPTMLEPNQTVEVTVHVGPTANVFDVGHRIAVWISSSSFPRFDPNPNTGEPIGRHTHTRVATNRIHHDPAHPSAVLLPIAPAHPRPEETR